MKKVELYPLELFDLLDEYQKEFKAPVDSWGWKQENTYRKSIQRFRMRCCNETVGDSEALDLIAIDVARLSSIYLFCKKIENEKNKQGTVEELVADEAFENAKQCLYRCLEECFGMGTYLTVEMYFRYLLNYSKFLDLVADEKRHLKWKRAHKDHIKQYYSNKKLEY